MQCHNGGITFVFLSLVPTYVSCESTAHCTREREFQYLQQRKYFIFNDTSTTYIYSLPCTTLFRSYPITDSTLTIQAYGSIIYMMALSRDLVRICIRYLYCYL